MLGYLGYVLAYLWVISLVAFTDGLASAGYAVLDPTATYALPLLGLAVQLRRR
jgi:uncharacterized protein (TIGR03382 family)